MRITRIGVISTIGLLTLASISLADVIVSTGSPDGLLASASRPSSAGKIEVETGDDFILNATGSITGATFYGLIPSNAPLTDLQDIHIEIYRVFPKDSQDPPSGNVPTRANSPSDVAFAEKDAVSNDLTFTTNLLSASFSAGNSVLNGIHRIPGQHTGGDGPVTGQEVQFNVTFKTPFTLPADHYFFVPQVLLSNGDFYWLSAPKPISGAGGTTLFTPDLQAWIRNEDLAPDWLRIGGDIVGGAPAPAFNMAFTLDGTVVPEPSAAPILLLGTMSILAFKRKWGRRFRFRLPNPILR